MVAPAPLAIKLTGATAACWKATVTGGEPVYVVADGLAAAAARLETALGASVTGMERVGPAVG